MHVSICIATYKRPALLAELLECLRRQRLDTNVTFDVLVVDNDPEVSASEVVAVAQIESFGVKYLTQPAKSISLTRNLALDRAQGELIAFLDDDEQVATDWLMQMLTCLEFHEADCVFGPVDGLVPSNAPAWIKRGSFYSRPRLASGTTVPYGGAGNVLMRSRCLSDGHRFDPRFGRTGGEDTDFFFRLRQKGSKLIWCAEANATESIPTERLSLRWLLRRAFRSGQAYADIVGRPPRGLRQGAWVLHRLTFVAVALTLASVVAPFDRARCVKWILKVATNVGQLTTIFRYRFEEYK